jgi:hypothetical protein
VHEYTEQAGTAFLPDRGIIASDPRIGAFPQMHLVGGWKIEHEVRGANRQFDWTFDRSQLRSAKVTISVAFP